MTPLELIAALIRAGDSVSILDGRLSLATHDSRAVPPTWLQQNEPQIVTAISAKLGWPIFQYLGYTTGNYGPANAGGLTLQLLDTQSCGSAYVIFNVDTRYRRNTKFHKCGARLPRGKFTAPKNGQFVKFWSGCGLPLPQRMGAFSDRMGKLKPLYFTGERIACERLNATSFCAINVDEKTVRELVGLSSDSQTVFKQLSNNYQTKTVQAQQTTKPLETLPDKASSTIQATGHFRRGYKDIRGCGYKGPTNTPVKTLSEQSITEWLHDYDQAS